MAEDAAPHRRASSRRGREEHEIEFTRIVAFSDGVFAIAITLLVLEIRPPENTHELAHELGELWPSYVAYIVSFLLIGLVWAIAVRRSGAPGRAARLVSALRNG
jgi:uncharacterized membrane protein